MKSLAFADDTLLCHGKLNLYGGGELLFGLIVISLLHLEKLCSLVVLVSTDPSCLSNTNVELLKEEFVWIWQGANLQYDLESLL